MKGGTRNTARSGLDIRGEADKLAQAVCLQASGHFQTTKLVFGIPLYLITQFQLSIMPDLEKQSKPMVQLPFKSEP